MRAEALRGGDGDDGRHVLDLECLRTRRFEKDDAGIRPDQGGDFLAEPGIVEGRLDADPLEEPLAETARRLIDGIADEDVIARFHNSEQRERDGRKPRGREHGAGGAGDVGPCRFQRLGRRRAMRAVGIFGIAGDEIGIGAVKHGRAAIDRRIDETVLIEWVTARMHQLRAVLQRPALVRFRHRPILDARDLDGISVRAAE